MNKYVLILLTILLYSCNTKKTEAPLVSEGAIVDANIIVYEKDWDEYPRILFHTIEDCNIEQFLNLPFDHMVKYSVTDEKLLKQINQYLSTSEQSEEVPSIPNFDTDFVVIIQYKSQKKDTIAFSFDPKRPFLMGTGLFVQPYLSKFFIDLIGLSSPEFIEFKNRHYYKNTYRYCSKPEWKRDGFLPLPPDYSCFEKSTFKELAYALYKDDSLEVIQTINRNPYCKEGLKSKGSLLSSCVLFQQDEMLEILLDKGFNTEVCDLSVFDFTPLMIACESSHYIKSLNILIKHGANVNHFVPYSALATPLHVCVQSRNIRAAELLLSYDADMYIHNSHNLTAFDLSMKSRYYKMAYLFIANGYNRQYVTIDDYRKTTISEYLDSHPATNCEDEFFANKIRLLIENSI